MKNLKEFVKIEEHLRVVSAWKYLPSWKRKLLRAKFQLEVLRVTFPPAFLRAIAIFVAFVFFIVTPLPRSNKNAHWIQSERQ